MSQDETCFSKGLHTLQISASHLFSASLHTQASLHNLILFTFSFSSHHTFSRHTSFSSSDFLFTSVLLIYCNLTYHLLLTDLLFTSVLLSPSPFSSHRGFSSHKGFSSPRGFSSHKELLLKGRSFLTRASFSCLNGSARKSWQCVRVRLPARCARAGPSKVSACKSRQDGFLQEFLKNPGRIWATWRPGNTARCTYHPVKARVSAQTHTHAMGVSDP